VAQGDATDSTTGETKRSLSRLRSYEVRLSPQWKEGRKEGSAKQAG